MQRRSGFLIHGPVSVARRAALLAALVGLLVIVACAVPPRSLAAGSNFEWIQRTPATGPLARTYPSLAEDPASGGVVLFGGAVSINGPQSLPALDDTWTWDGSEWTEQHPGATPPGRFAATMAYDAAAEEVVLFGGNDRGTLYDDTWTWDGSEWTERHPATSPPARWGATMAYDAATEEVILFGGLGEGVLYDDTWTWDGSEWTEQHPPAGPPVRINATMAYDAATEEVVLFGGSGEAGNVNDTWTWDGSEWTERHPATSPPTRHEATMAYDATDAQVVIFSGSQGIGPLRADTWTWDGSEWTEQHPVTPPPARYGGAMAYDPTSGRVLVFGGQGADGSLLSDAWTGGLKALQTISFPAIADLTLGDVDIAPGAIASSGLPVTYTSQTEAVCTIVAGKVHLVATGECEVTAGQAGDAEWEPAPAVQRSFQVAPVSQPQPEPRVQPAADASPTPATSAPPSPRAAPPKISIRHRPRRGHLDNGPARYTVVLGKAAPGVAFYCSLDGGPFKRCGAKVVYRHLRPGPHVFRVKSVDSAGQASPVKVVRFSAAGGRAR